MARKKKEIVVPSDKKVNDHPKRSQKFSWWKIGLVLVALVVIVGAGVYLLTAVLPSRTSFAANADKTESSVYTVDYIFIHGNPNVRSNPRYTVNDDPIGTKVGAFDDGKTGNYFHDGPYNMLVVQNGGLTWFGFRATDLGLKLSKNTDADGWVWISQDYVVTSDSSKTGKIEGYW
ncbi:hypothetical protein FWF48_03060 [Candidatus Saccharibacteria bacterium]|nr:hypothetical protein [Candidatus Saccharibacteria bacterium]